MEKKKIYWFVEPLDANTNEIIFKNFYPLEIEDEITNLKDKDDVYRAVFQVKKYAVITRLYRDQEKFSLSFKVYFREGKNGKLRPWRFGYPK